MDEKDKTLWTRTWTLPDGSRLRMPVTQARAVWEVWLGMSPILTNRGEGLRLFQADAAIVLAAVGAERDQAVVIYVNPDGTVVDCSEAYAPVWERAVWAKQPK